VAALDRTPGVRACLGLHEAVCTGAADGYAVRGIVVGDYTGAGLVGLRLDAMTADHNPSMHGSKRLKVITTHRPPQHPTSTKCDWHSKERARHAVEDLRALGASSGARVVNTRPRACCIVNARAADIGAHGTNAIPMVVVWTHHPVLAHPPDNETIEQRNTGDRRG